MRVSHGCTVGHPFERRGAATGVYRRVTVIKIAMRGYGMLRARAMR
jgi:hypothetical protein